MEEEKKVSDRIENRKLIALSEGMVKIYEVLTLCI